MDIKESSWKRPDEERYYFYRLYSIDFDTTQHSLRVLRRYRRQDVRVCIWRDIVVSYARPFSGNRGERTRNHQLEKKFVPAEFRALHEELLRLRCEQLAHTDRTYYNPKAVDWSRAGRKWFPMSFRGYDFSNLDAQVPSIERLVAAVERNLQLEIDAIENIRE
jgi:hypothetical protein